MAEIRRAHPEAIGAILGGHGITAWGDTSAECEARSLEIIRTAERFIAENGRPEPFGRADPRLRAAAREASATPARPRSCRSSAGWPRPTGRRSATTPTARSCSTSSAGRSTRGWRRSARRARTTSCGPRSGRWSSTCRRPRISPTCSHGCASCTRPTATDYARLLRAQRRRPTARRCAARTRRSCWSRASGCSRSGPTSRPRASPASSTSTRSTSCAAPRRCRPTPRSRNRRSSGSSTGRSRRPSWRGCRSRSRSRPGSRS